MTTALPAHLGQFEIELKRMAQRRTIYTLIGIAAAAMVVTFGVGVANEQNAGSLSRGMTNFFNYPADMIGQAWAAGWDWPPLLVKHFPDLLATINMGLFSTFDGFIFAVILSCLASNNLMRNGAVVQATRRFLYLCRSFLELSLHSHSPYLM